MRRGCARPSSTCRPTPAATACASWSSCATAAWSGAATTSITNNDLFVIPEWDLVAVRLGFDEQADGKITEETYGTFLALLGEAIVE